MDYYIITDNQRHGPYDIEQLKTIGLTRSTKVWREGLDEWTDAADVPELAALAAPDFTPPTDTAGRDYPKPIRPPMPKTWLVESIVVTLLCCLVFGIIAIVYSTQVESNYISGNYEMAEYKSRQARNMVLWAVGIWAAMAIIYLGFILFAFVMSPSY